MEKQELRSCIAAVEQEISLLEGTDKAGSEQTALRKSWARLVGLLAVGPAPATRACPSCARLIMRDATRCMHCWAKSAPGK